MYFTSQIPNTLKSILCMLQSQMKRKGDHDKANIINDYLVAGVFVVTVINVFAAAFTTTDK